MHTIGTFPTALATLHDLQACFDVAYPIHVLIDPLLGEPLPGVMILADAAAQQRAREDRWERAITTITLPARVSLSSHLHPYLVTLAGPDDPLLGVTLRFAHAERTQSQTAGLDGEGGAAHRIGAWINSSIHTDLLGQQIARMCDARAAGSLRATYLRLVDRRTFGLLTLIAGSVRVSSMLGRIRSWTCLDPAGRLTSVHSQAETEVSLRLEREEWRLLERGEAVHRALGQYLGHLAQLARDPVGISTDLYQRFIEADQGTDDAVRLWPHRFAGMHDRTTWTALSVLHPGLVNNPLVRDLMQDRGSESQPAELARYLHEQLSEAADRYTAPTIG